MLKKNMFLLLSAATKKQKSDFLQRIGRCRNIMRHGPIMTIFDLSGVCTVYFYVGIYSFMTRRQNVK